MSVRHNANVIRVLAVASAVAASVVTTGDARASASRHVHWTGKVVHGRTLVVDEADGAHALLSLPAWATVDQTVLSPSREHALVYAQAHTGETRTVFVLDLVKHVVEGSYKPGVGGQFFFTADDRVFQYWGCGTQCAGLQVRARSGVQLFQSVCAGFDDEQELSSDRHFAACFGGDSSLSVIDLDRGKTLSRQSIPCAGADRDEVKIDSKEGKVRLTCEGASEKRYAVTVSFGAVQRVTSRLIQENH
ncbi:MAG: hypothetical protein ACRELY_21410 [Polyangiaceae bacterium]